MRTLLLLAALLTASAAAQPVDVTFRFIPDLTPETTAPVRAYLPGSFNDWGPNSNGQIAVDAPSRMTYAPQFNEYRYTVPLQAGQTYTYKVHLHLNNEATQYVWLSDPLNGVTTGPNSDSVIEVTDPMAFQLARHLNANRQLTEVSAGIFGTEEITELTFALNGVEQDGLPFYDAATGVFSYRLPAPLPGSSQFAIRAVDAEGGVAADTVGVIPPTVVDQPRPAGLEDGITFVDASTVRLSLFAPGKSFVHVVGSFNGWTADDASLMRRDALGADSAWWWTEISGLTPGAPVSFQYLVDGELRVADPYAPQVLLPEDAGIPSTAYPNRPPYPAEAQGAPATLITPGAAPYEWQVNDFQRPAQKDLVIYELLLRDFLAAHDWDTLADTLDYLDRLGVNAIELMPVSEFGGNLNWGYQPTFHLALDKYYGPPDQFKAFVDAAHARGMAVILDVVYNHADQPSPLVTLYGCTEAGPYTNNPARHPFNVFCDLDHTNPATQHWLDRANRWWMEEYRVDGYRFDLAGGFMQTGNFFGYNAQRVGLLKRMADRIWDFDDEAILIMENLIESNQEYLELARHGKDEGRPGLMLWHHMNHNYAEASMGYLNAGSNLRDTYPPFWISGMPLSGPVTYMESHDEQWLMYKNRTYGACTNFPAGGDGCETDPGPYNVRDLATALDRQKLVGGFFFPVPGARMMWQFGELGYGGGPNECLVNGDYPGECPQGTPGRTDVKPIRWNYQDDPDRQRLYKTWAALIGLRHDHDLFTHEDTEVQIQTAANRADRWIVLTLPVDPAGGPAAAVIVGNFGLTERTVAPPWPATGTWYDFFNDGAIEVAEASQAVTLRPGEFRIYTDTDIPSPEGGLIVAGEGGPVDGPLRFGLDAVYPNPAGAAARLAYTLEAPADVRLEVFDLLGRRVAVVAEGPRPAGVHRAELATSALATGTYVVRLAAGARTEARRFTVVR